VTLTGFKARPRPAQLLNISTRGYVKAGDDPFSNFHLIGGFIITGTEPKPIVVRGLGPSLAQHNVTAVLPDPVITLHRSDKTIVAANDDWKSTQQDRIAALGLAPSDEREAAIYAKLNPGEYTVVLQEKTGTPGNALVEVYDLSPKAASKLGNISARGFVNPGSPLIGGIIAREGQANAEIVVRAIGPQLRRNGVFDAMEDPTLELRDANGDLLAFNDNWFDNEEQFRGGMYDLAPPNSTESAMRVSVPAGLYTAIVRGKDGIGGSALVEFYDLRR